MKKSWAIGIWKVVPLAIYWRTWKERNREIFEGTALSLRDFKLYLLRKLCSWSLVLNCGINMSLLDFVPKLCMKAWGHYDFCTWPFYIWVEAMVSHSYHS